MWVALALPKKPLLKRGTDSGDQTSDRPFYLTKVSAVDAVPGFFIATGFSGHGFGIGPAAGRLMAELVSGETPVVDPLAFRYSRFTDGTRPRPSPLA